MPNHAGTPRAKPLAPRVLVIGHRGAPAYFPEHTLASYARAIADGADFIEPDLVMTRDGVPVSRHENGLGGTTDVADHPEFADRRATRTVDGRQTSDWFSEDFTFAELQALRARERLPQLRGTRHDGRFRVPDLDEIIEFVAAESAACGRTIGIIPEIKYGTYFRNLDLAMEDRVLEILAAHAYTRTAPVEIQSFEIGNLKYLRTRIGEPSRTNIRLLQLLGAPHELPHDVAVAGGRLTYGEMMTPEGLRDVATYADAIGPHADAVIPRTPDDRLDRPTRLVSEAHAAGLLVQPYTFRPENRFLASEFRKDGNPDSIHGEGLTAQIRVFLDAGIDAFFTDDPAAGRRAVDHRSPDPAA